MSSIDDVIDSNEWELLISRIQNGYCTPFIGGEICAGMNEIQTAIVSQWAKKYEDYPFEDNADLHRAAQFVAVRGLDIAQRAGSKGASQSCSTGFAGSGQSLPCAG